MSYAEEVVNQLQVDIANAVVDPVVESVGVLIDPITHQLMRVFIGPSWGLFLMCLGYLLFDLITPFDTAKELQNGNLAVGVVVCGILMGVGICVGIPLGFSLF